MYKLLLATHRPEVREAFAGVTEISRLMFEPVFFADSAKEAIQRLDSYGADAVGFDLPDDETQQMWDYLHKSQPWLPVFFTRYKGEQLRAELSLVREFLDQLHADYSDYDIDTEQTMLQLQQEVMRRLLEGRIQTRQELHSRLMLSRSSLWAHLPCLLFDFHLPDGHHFLEGRWHHGFERLDFSLRANFFGRIGGPMIMSACLVDPTNFKVIAIAPRELTDKEVDRISTSVQEEVLKAANLVKSYMDLDMVCTKFSVLSGLNDLVTG